MTKIYTDIMAGDEVLVRATGRRKRKVVSVHDNYCMVERAYNPPTKPITPAKIYYSQILQNMSAARRFERNAFFEEHIEEFEQVLEDLTNV